MLQLRKLLFVVLGFCATLNVPSAHATATAWTGLSVTCAATGSSTQVVAAAANRETIVISNTSGVTVRVGAAASGTAALTGATSIQVLAGQSVSDSSPTIFTGRLVCMSTDATPRAVEVIETRK